MNSPWWIRAHWGRAFEIVELIPHDGGDPPHGHGLVMMRKKPVELTIEDLIRPEPDEPRELSAMQLHIEQLAGETVRLREELELSGNGDGARSAVQAMEGSASWRLTAPLRTAKRRLRR